MNVASGWHPPGHPPFPYVLVAGNIATGKTTAVSALADRLGLRKMLENVDANPYFSLYYAEPVRWSFHALVAFMQLALVAHLEAATGATGAVQDRGIQEGIAVFTNLRHELGHLTDAEFQVLDRLSRDLVPLLPQPDLLLFLTAPASELMARISARGRAEEARITINLLRRLDAHYAEFIAGWDDCPVLSIDTTLVDVRLSSGARDLGEAVSRSLAASERKADAEHA